METDIRAYNLITTVNDHSLSYDDIGEGSIPIIFLHGYPFDKSMWAGQLESLKLTHRSIAYDIRGFGASTDEMVPLNIDLFAEDLIAFMDRLDIDKAVVCGLSMGGFIALNAFKKYPHRLEALILCDTQCIADTEEVSAKRYTIIDGVTVNGVADFNEGFIKSVFHGDSLNHKNELVERLRKVVFANSPHIITAGLRALAERSETCSILGSIDIPTLIICGREDEVTPLVQSEFMHRTIKGSVLCVIENAGHVSNLEQPEEFNKHLLSFLRALGGVRVPPS